MGPLVPPYERLKLLPKQANYDEALKIVLGWDLRTILNNAPRPLQALQLLCMIVDVLDYGGDYDTARTIPMETEATAAAARLSTIHSIRDLEQSYAVADRPYLKQECWALMMWGMCLYRDAKYKEAKKLFERAKHVLTLLHDSGAVSCIGTLARVWYCIGLVDREEHHYRSARMAFRHSIEFTGEGIQRRAAVTQSTVSFDYHLARCYGLGIGWIAYDEALLTEAIGELVLARRLMLSKNARFISAYIDLVHGSIMLSESSALARIDDAITLLKSAHATFASQTGPKHVPYQLRTENELARAYLRRARTEGADDRNRDLETAEGYIRGVKANARGPRGIKVRCAALITEARIWRERGDYGKASDAAIEAKQKGGHLTFTLIDACIGIGEAAMGVNNYRRAIAEFDEALRVGKDSPKISAVCHLHMCGAYLDDNEPAKAFEEYKLWQVSAGGLENAFIANLAAQLDKRITHVFEDFVLTKEDVRPLQSYDVYLNWLRRWLADTAFALEGDNEQHAADRLSQSVVAFRRWRAFPRKPI